MSGNFQNSGWLVPFLWLGNVCPGPEPGADSQSLSASFSGLCQVNKLFILVSEPVPDSADTQRLKASEGLVHPCPHLFTVSPPSSITPGACGNDCNSTLRPTRPVSQRQTRQFPYRPSVCSQGPFPCQDSCASFPAPLSVSELRASILPLKTTVEISCLLPALGSPSTLLIHPACECQSNLPSFALQSPAQQPPTAAQVRG